MKIHWQCTKAEGHGSFSPALFFTKVRMFNLNFKAYIRISLLIEKKKKLAEAHQAGFDREIYG